MRTSFFQRRTRFSVAYLASLFFASALFGLNPEHKLTQYVHRIWQTQHGLPQTTIFAIAQARPGYLWLGTESGIVRFDGVRFTPVPELEKASLGEARARALAEDARGRMWILSSNFGLIRVGEDGVKVFTAADGLPRGSVSCVFAGSTGDVWVCTPSGIARITGDHLESFSNGLQGHPAAACESPDGTIWVGGERWVAALGGTESGLAFTETALRTLPPGASVRSLVCRKDGLWIGATAGLFHLSEGKERRYTSKDGLPDSAVLSLEAGSNGELWVGTRSGLNRFLNGAFETFSYGDGLSQKDVYATYEDREGSLWIATKYGLNQFVDGPAIRFTRKEGLPSNSIGPVLEDRSGTLWVGLLDAGLARWGGRHFITVPELASRDVVALMEGKDGAIWVGTNQGLSEINGGKVTETFDTRRGLPSNRIRSLFYDRAGNVWAGTDNGVAVYRGGSFVQPPEFLADLRRPIVAIGETREGEMLFSAEHGQVFVFANGKLHVLEDRDNPTMSTSDVLSMYTEADGSVWMGTEGLGLWLFKDGKIRRFLRSDGLFDGEIYGFTADSKGRLWMACSKGFYSIPKAELLAFSEGKLRKLKSSPYIPLEGVRAIQGRQGVQPSAITGRDGKLWFTTLEGLIAYDPNAGNGDTPPPPVLIEDVTVGGKPTDPSDFQHFGPGEQNLAFRYTGFSFLAPESMTFRYKLEGYDRDWTDAGTRREAFYMNLPAGTFRFRVTACAPFAPCNEIGSGVDFRVVPFLYQRTWFWPLCAAALGLLVWLGHRLRIVQLHSQFSLIAAERTRIARELHDTLIQGFSGITMQMQALSDRLRSPSERGHLEAIIADASHCLRETRQSVAGLRDFEIASPELATTIADAAEALTAEHSIALVLKLERTRRQISAGIKYNLVRIVQEAVTNAVKHSGATEIGISLVDSKDELRLSVSDNGCGIAPAQEDNDHALHYGIVGMRERSEHIGAEFDLRSARGHGTTVTVVVRGGRRVAQDVETEKAGSIS